MSVIPVHEVVKRENHKISITENELIDILYKSWIQSKRCKCSMGEFTPEYVTQDGHFEYWLDTGHGSGITYSQIMSDDDLAEYKAFKLMRMVSV